MYNDDYPTCYRTYATLIIYPGDTDPEEISERLGLEPSRSQRRGEDLNPAGRTPRIAPLNGWFLSSKEHIDSRDSRRHLDWILEQIAPKRECVRAIRAGGCRVEISCYWCSAAGHGGPMVTPAQMRIMADCEVDLWFDFYGPYEEDDTARSAP